MKGKPTWKPTGLSAKRWRAADKTRGPANLLSLPKPPKGRRERKGNSKRALEASRPEKVLVELTMTPLGRGSHLSKDLAQVLKIIDQSRLPYSLTPWGTCIEGGWDEVMALVKRCHQQARSLANHVLTSIRIEDEAGATNKLTENIAAVERAVGHPLRNQMARSSVTL